MYVGTQILIELSVWLMGETELKETGNNSTKIQSVYDRPTSYRNANLMLPVMKKLQ